jgi:RNA polymerase sigma-70 factor, ECF subfamily
MEFLLTNRRGVRHTGGLGFISLSQSMDEDQKREAFAQCWIEADPSVSAYVCAAVASFHDAEDVVQRVAQDLARRFGEYDSDRPFVGWALWIAKSRVIDFYRSQKRSQLVFSNELLQRLADTIVVHAESRSHRREALQACLDELPTKSRRLLDLRYVDELPAAEVAREIDSTSGSVRVLLTRVRTALANCIQRRLATEPA